MVQTPQVIAGNLSQVFTSDFLFGGTKPDIAVNQERCQMKKAYEDVAKFIRWALIGLALIIVALPTLTSVSSSI